MHTRLLVLTLPILASSFTMANEVNYHIRISPTSEDQLRFSASTRHLGKFTVKPPRSLTSAMPPALSCLQDELFTSIQYGTEVECDKIEWQTSAEKVPEQGFEPSNQNDSYSPQHGWYFVSEYDSLPRIPQADITLVCTPDQRCYTLPDPTLPPLFLVWGMDTARIPISGQHVRVHVEDAKVIDAQQRWLPTMQKQLSYLHRVFPQSNMAGWELAFFKRDKNAGSLGGAAGANMLLVNSLLDQGELTDESLQLLLKISAHESIHYMDKRKNSLWKSESLAEYYALKSLMNTEITFESPETLWQQFAQKYPLATTGLYEAEHQVLEQGNRQYYPLFYFKGAAFWYALDQALQAHRASLDQWQQIELGREAELDAKIITQLQAIIGEERWQALAEKYL
ncbi:hypothetical protein K6U70_22030 [Vibrio vulnificus]|uniref:hypothetical protein n=1 Tax=Vibrio vulnificus TaxID=672 RepID=UPI001EE9C552|nr:hypothetical protein [Vibrio vulnificus]MCG6274798.1 hypothetical protein [Vibrio vulnificus]